MFFYQRKYSSIKTRIVKVRDDWGVLRKVEIIVAKPEPTDQELQEQLQSTVIVRRYDYE
jgi:hypothetical protein